MDSNSSADESVLLYAAGMINKFLTAIEHEIPGVKEAVDIESIHRIRVSSRRLRNALDVFSFCFSSKKSNKWNSAIHLITQSLGSARDLDVQIDLLNNLEKGLTDQRHHLGIRRLLLRIGQNRQKQQKKVAKALGNLQRTNALEDIRDEIKDHLIQETEIKPPSQNLYLLSGKIIPQRLKDFLQFKSDLFQPDRIQEHHKMRIAAKKLRYSLEIFAPLYSNHLADPLEAATHAQEALGTLHDCDVWIEYLPAFIQSENKKTLEYSGNTQIMRRLLPGINYFSNNRQVTRQVTYNQFLKTWQDWEADNLWEKLLQTIQLPIVNSITIYPPSKQDLVNMRHE
jgi:CHAD domain-containing protein